MRQRRRLIGGEGNGGVIDPRVGWVRDPFIGMALILNLLAQTGKKISELVAELPSYAIVKDKYALPRERLPACLRSAAERWPRPRSIAWTVCVSTGRKAGCIFGRSNTEEIVRVIAEAPDKEEARKLCSAVGEVLRETA